ncbi:MAG TPA: hypothetical protein P5102_06435 [Candidatus Competibacteraceae bacterium]|nr:hypothetical protein [Candidatus Competibacteraceae bacterium]HRZ05776.1 hypothetical protein [Candidatus Competibacteraceae bacterium]HSA47244.1 hypothetical protein [Candidatus Competibacteraceae bacterium]
MISDGATGRNGTVLHTQDNIGLLLLGFSTPDSRFRSLLKQLYEALAGTG